MAFSFSLSPGRATNTPLDFTDRGDARIFTSATTPEEEKYDLSHDGLRTFLGKVNKQAMKYGWEIPSTGVLSIPDELNAPAPPAPDNRNWYDLTTDYGRFPLEYI